MFYLIKIYFLNLCSIFWCFGLKIFYFFIQIYLFFYIISAPADPQSNGLSVGAIVGIAIGSIAGVVLLIAASYCIIKKCSNPTPRGTYNISQKCKIYTNLSFPRACTTNN
jgi:hypothetical protein